MRVYAFQNLDGDFSRPYRESDKLLLAWVGHVPGDGQDEAECESVFELLNRDDRPNRYVAPSLSIGDVITFAGDAVATWAVEGQGFRRVPEIMPDAAQAGAYHTAVDEAETLMRPILRPEQREADETRGDPRLARRERPELPEARMIRDLDPSIADGWLTQIRARLVDDNDAVADVDLLYSIYVALTGEDIPHPYEIAGELGGE